MKYNKSVCSIRFFAPIALLLLTLPLSSCYKSNVQSMKEGLDANQITTLVENGQTTIEFRNNGRLYRVEVTPKNGKTYIIYPDQQSKNNLLNDELQNSETPKVHWKIIDF